MCTSVLSQGDRVAVVAGDLTGMKGRVQRIDEDGMVHVKAQDLDGVSEAIEIEARDLVKYFNVRSLLLHFLNLLEEACTWIVSSLD